MKMRKKLIIIGIVLAVLILLAGSGLLYLRHMMTRNVPDVSILEAAKAATVSTTGGDVMGYISNGIYTYHGIPYASVDERFVMPTEVEPWDGVLDVSDYGSISPQGNLLGFGGNGNDTGDNDCLNLNLWTPGIRDGKKRPVMVWFHGGGFSTGSANDPSSDGEALAAYGDVVVVGVNHRLNLYGYMDLSAYGEKYTNGGNQGLGDLIASLQWIHNNIEAFGGDPDNVTVFGQSGGGAKVLALMTAPEAKGLFHKGIVQSGATDTMGLTFATKEQSLALTEEILSRLSITEANIEDIQTKSNQELQEASNAAMAVIAEKYRIPQAFGNGYAMEWGPVVDGEYLPTNPVTEDGFADAGFDVPLMIGSNLNEWAMMGASPSADSVTDEIKAEFMKAYPEESEDEITRLDTLLRYPLLKITRHKAMQGGSAVYSYILTYDDGIGGAYHGAEIPFVFHHADGNQLNDTISDFWVNFARTGTPSSANAPAWEPYTLETGAEMIIDTKPYMAYHHDFALLKLLKPTYDLD